MRSLLLCSAIFLLSGCGESFFPTKTSDGETSTTSASSGSTGSSSSSVGGSSATTSSSNTTGGSGGSGGFVNETYSISDCVADYVFVPWSGYDLINSPAVSCISVPEGQSSLTIDSFTYNLFQGTVIPTAFDCDATDHLAVWFTTKLSNGKVVIPNNVSLSSQAVSVASLTWSDWSTSDLEGQVSPVNVIMHDSVTIIDDELFCFGHRFVNSVDSNPTCLVSCRDEVNYQHHQISDSKDNPYNFNPANSWPPDGNVNVNYSFVVSVLGFTQ